MIRHQRWTPDTCANPSTGDTCVWIEEWDDAVDPLVRTHTLVSRERVCSFHAAETPQAGFDRCYNENRRKNMAWRIATTVKSGLALEQFTWSYGSNGVLTVSAVGLTGAQKIALQNACDLQFGVGKAVVT